MFKTPMKVGHLTKSAQNPHESGSQITTPFFDKKLGSQNANYGGFEHLGVPKSNFRVFENPKVLKTPMKVGSGVDFLSKKGGSGKSSKNVSEPYKTRFLPFLAIFRISKKSKCFLDPFSIFSGFTLKMSNRFFDSEKRCQKTAHFPDLKFFSEGTPSKLKNSYQKSFRFVVLESYLR